LLSIAGHQRRLTCPRLTVFGERRQRRVINVVTWPSAPQKLIKAYRLLKATMAEAELHVLRARLEGGIKNKASRGELRRRLPVGLVWGEAGGRIRFHPDEAVTGVITAAFEQFAVRGSVRATWLWLRGQGLRWPLQRVAYAGKGGVLPEITWVEPTYHFLPGLLLGPARRDQRAGPGDGVLIQRRGAAGHLDHRGRAAPRNAVRCPPAGPGRDRCGWPGQSCVRSVRSDGIAWRHYPRVTSLT
jgi:hypothetical protein